MGEGQAPEVSFADVQGLHQRLNEQDAQIKSLLAALEAKKPETDRTVVDINDVRVPYVLRPFPTTVHRPNPKHVGPDHIGYDAKAVSTPEEVSTAVSAGWLDLEAYRRHVADGIEKAARKGGVR